MTALTDRLAANSGVSERHLPTGVPGFLTRLAGGIALAVSMIHWSELPGHWTKQPWLGALFVVGSAALLYSSYALLRRPSLLSWTVAAATMVGMFGGGIASRTTGLPGVLFDKWNAALIISLILELCFLGLWAVQGFGRRNTGSPARD